MSAAGRKLEKPVVHYTLSWAKDERPDRAEMNRAAEETLKALGLERHQALIVAHNDKTHPHVHLVVNRVDPATGKAGEARQRPVEAGELGRALGARSRRPPVSGAGDEPQEAGGEQETGASGST